jgi:hypothetical protein
MQVIHSFTLPGAGWEIFGMFLCVKKVFVYTFLVFCCVSKRCRVYIFYTASHESYQNFGDVFLCQKGQLHISTVSAAAGKKLGVFVSKRCQLYTFLEFNILRHNEKKRKQYELVLFFFSIPGIVFGGEGYKTSKKHCFRVSSKNETSEPPDWFLYDPSNITPSTPTSSVCLITNHI